MTSKEALESLRQECKATFFDEKGKQWWTTDKKSDYRCNIIEKDLEILKIIKANKNIIFSKKPNYGKMSADDFFKLKEWLNNDK